MIQDVRRDGQGLTAIQVIYDCWAFFLPIYTVKYVPKRSYMYSIKYINVSICVHVYTGKLRKIRSLKPE